MFLKKLLLVLSVVFATTSVYAQSIVPWYKGWDTTTTYEEIVSDLKKNIIYFKKDRRKIPKYP